MNQQAKCLKCGNLRPSDELICGACGAFLQPSDQPLNTGSTILLSSHALLYQIHVTQTHEKYAAAHMIKHVRRPMNRWLTIGAAHSNLYFLDNDSASLSICPPIFKDEETY